MTLWHTIWRLFSRFLATRCARKTADNLVTINETDAPLPAPIVRISHCAPLFELQKQRQLLEVVSDGESYQSFIISANVIDELLILDELFPFPAENAPQPGDQLTIRHHKKGKVLSFTSPILGINHNQGALTYTLRLPVQACYRQRRRSPRVSFSHRPPLAVHLQSPLRSPWYATAVDLSSGGMRLTVAGNITSLLKRDTVLPQCEFQFNPEFRIRCQAAVKAFRFVRKPYRQTQISVAFIGIEPHHRMQLQQYIDAMLNFSGKAA